MQKIRSKFFIIITSIYIIALTILMFWSDIKELLFSNEDDTIAIINETDANIEQLLQTNDSFAWEFVNRDGVEEKLEKGDYYAALTLTDADGKLAAKVESFDPLPLNDQQEFASILSGLGQLYTMGKLDLTDEQQQKLLQSEPQMTLETINKDALDGKSADEKMAGVWASYIVGIIIYSFVATYLSIITTEVASEKGSRALEMLLVSVKPETHFKAKLVGMFLVACTQFGILFAALLLLLRFTNGGDNWSLISDITGTLSVGYFIYVICFLFVTIFMYLILGALLGSLVSKVEEGGQVMMPAMMLTLIGFYIMLTGVGNPDTMLIKVFSYIPFTSGMIMPMRIGATDINAAGPIISLAVLVVTTLLLYYISIVFYKRSVLTYSSGGVIQKIKTVFKVTT